MFDAGSIMGTLGLDMSGFEGGMLRATSIASLFPSTVTNFMANPLLGVIGIAKDAANAIGDAIGTGVKLAADFEQAEVALGTMLGSAANAKAVLADLSDFAAATPFELPELVTATKSLVAFGVDQQNLMTTLQQVGDVAAGLGIPFNELAQIYGKAKVQGTLFMEDINQLAGRGIPIQQELARQFGITTSEVKALVSSGQVGFANLQQAFASLTAEGGKFHGMMEAQSKTLAGLWSSLEDAKNTVLRDVGGKLIEAFDIRSAVNDATKYITDHKEQILETVTAIAEGASRLIPIVQVLGSETGKSVSTILRGVTTLLEWTDTLTDALDRATMAVDKFVGAGGKLSDWMKKGGAGMLGDLFPEEDDKIHWLTAGRERKPKAEGGPLVAGLNDDFREQVSGSSSSSAPFDLAGMEERRLIAEKEISRWADLGFGDHAGLPQGKSVADAYWEDLGFGDAAATAAAVSGGSVGFDAADLSKSTGDAAGNVDGLSVQLKSLTGLIAPLAIGVKDLTSGFGSLGSVMHDFEQQVEASITSLRTAADAASQFANAANGARPQKGTNINAPVTVQYDPTATSRQIADAILPPLRDQIQQMQTGLYGAMLANRLQDEMGL